MGTDLPIQIIVKIMQYILGTFRRLSAPCSKDEDRARQELILNIILLASISLLTVLAGTIVGDMIVTGIHYRGIHLGWLLVILAIMISLLIVSKKGFARIASYLLILIYAIGATYSGYVWGASLPASLLTFCLVIVTSSVLIGSVYGIINALVAIIIIYGLGIHERLGLALTDWKLDSVTRSDIVAYSGIILFITTISWLSNSEIEKSLSRARKSEKALARERDNLEVTVEERTKALKQSQIEIMNELYRAAEFGKIAQGVFHDLINPLTSVSLNVEQLTRPNTNPTDIKIYTDRAVAITKKMSSYVSSVRKQIQSHELNEEFFINTEVADAVDVLTYKARMSNVKIIFNPTEKVSIIGNPLKINQVISNLVSNAIDALADIKKDAKIIIITLSQISEKEIKVVVNDNGRGIEDSTLAHIFDPFFTTKSKEKGSGIGLAIVKNIVEKDFKGNINVTSSDLGTSFEITLLKQS